MVKVIAQMTKLTNDFKSNFALLLVILNVNYTSATILNYSKTLNSWTKAGLKAEGRIIEKFNPETKAYDYVDTDPENPLCDIINASDKFYMEAMEKTEIQPNGSKAAWVQKEIRILCFKHDNLMFPLCVSEGLLDLKDVVGNAMDQLQNVGSGD